MESCAIRFVPTGRIPAGPGGTGAGAGFGTQLLPAAAAAAAAEDDAGAAAAGLSLHGSSVAMLSVPHDAQRGRPAPAGLALEIGIRGDFALCPPIPLTEEELVQGAVVIDAVDAKVGRCRLTPSNPS